MIKNNIKLVKSCRLKHLSDYLGQQLVREHQILLSQNHRAEGVEQCNSSPFYKALEPVSVWEQEDNGPQQNRSTSKHHRAFIACSADKLESSDASSYQ